MATRKSPRASIISHGVGSVAASFGPPFVDETAHLAGPDVFIAQGYTSIARHDVNERPSTALPGVAALYPADRERKHVAGLLGGKLTAETRDDWLPLAKGMNNLRIAACDAQNVTGYSELFFYSQPGAGHCEVGVETRKDLKERGPGGTTMGVTIDGDEKYQLDKLREYPYLPNLGQAEGWWETSVRVDKRSALYLTFGKSFFRRCVVKGLAGLHAGIWQFPEQKSAADAAVALGAESACVGMSFGIDHLLPSPGVGWYQPLAGRFGWPQHGRVNVKDAVSRAKAAVTQAITNPKLRALDEPVDQDRQGFVELTMPWPWGKKQDVQPWRELMAAVGGWMENTYPNFVLIWVAGDGVPLPGEERLSPHWVLASCFYPLPAVPSTIHALLDRDRGRAKTAPNGVPSPDELRALWRDLVSTTPNGATA